MKNTIKFFAVLAVMLGFAVGAMAQSNTDNDKISGKASIIQAMAVTQQVDLDFGIVSQGSAKSIGLTNNVTGLPNQGTQTTGRFLVSAAAATNVDLTFTTPSDLVSGGNNLPIGTYLYGWDVVSTFAGVTTFTGGTTDIAFPTNVVETVNGVYVFIGATVTPGASQVVGDYTADITLTATYN